MEEGLGYDEPSLKPPPVPGRVYIVASEAWLRRLVWSICVPPAAYLVRARPLARCETNLGQILADFRIQAPELAAAPETVSDQSCIFA